MRSRFGEWVLSTAFRPRKAAFDCDNTLVATEPLHDLGHQETLIELGVPLNSIDPSSDPMWIEMQTGNAVVPEGCFKRAEPDVVARLIQFLEAKSYSIGWDIATYMSMKSRIMRDRIKQGAWSVEAVDGGPQLVNAASEYLGGDWGVCTGSSLEMAQCVLGQLDITDRVPLWVTADDLFLDDGTKAPGKPDPWCYNHFWERSEADQDGRMVFEDRADAAIAARRSGALALLLPSEVSVQEAEDQLDALEREHSCSCPHPVVVVESGSWLPVVDWLSRLR